ncbi:MULTISPECIES: DUF4190 domain-containing protein [unclassified Mycolicibacterium]|uniref:DUF4190 domain-containing protein n=1 Tax=unclassified Mycolicibacterium TaxID=2636767 RepID=UPI001F4C02D7|nr:DUF4190 domain-containing protein [Mycolicibacterium sp. YH-1]UNB55383.1 DUF4190 domain-containing protein [Mycolicibacterium sp. YH-1]
MTGYPGGYPPPYQQNPYPGYGPPPPSAPRNGLGIAALVLAIVALLFFWSVVGGVVIGVVAVILGIAGRGRAKRGEASNGGVAVAGIALGALAIVVSLAFIAVWVGIFNEVGGADYLDCVANAGTDRTASEACADQLRDRVESRFSVAPTPTR